MPVRFAAGTKEYVGKRNVQRPQAQNKKKGEGDTYWKGHVTKQFAKNLRALKFI